MLEQRLEVDVPDPRHVLPVGDRVVERDDEHGGDAGLERAHDLVRPRRVLDQEEHDGLAARPDALEAAESGAEPLETVDGRRRATRRRASASDAAAVAL